MSKPLIIGMNNPQGNEPLWPDPPGCSGWRLWQMLRAFDETITKEQYLEAFDRRNLSDGGVWDKLAAAKNGEGILRLMETSQTVLLGRVVPAVLGLPRTPWCLPNGYEQGVWTVIPHPSGLTREYNRSKMVRAVGELLFELYSKSVGKAQ